MIRLGITIGHDASLAVADKDGKILFAAAEERFSRIKNHFGAPFRALDYMRKELAPTAQEIREAMLYVGGFFSGPDGKLLLYVLLNDEYQGKFDPFNQNYPPGFLGAIRKSREFNDFDPLLILSRRFGVSPANIRFIDHHDSHAASAFFASDFESALVLTLDGRGDNDSGTVSLMYRNGVKKELRRFDFIHSLGHLYSEVTKQYGFKESKHEGKITGLAAYFSGEHTVGIFDDLLKFRRGQLKFGIKYLIDPRLLGSISIKPRINARRAFELAVNRAEYLCYEHPQLASEIQRFLEVKVKEILKWYMPKEFESKIVVAGGVFANVTLNARIREVFPNADLYVFPNMGDGGLAVGAIWEGMRLANSPIVSLAEMQSMYLGNDLEQNSKVTRSPISPESLANHLLEDRIVGILFGKMEFGPRALCHRSILASPKDLEMTTVLNQRLSRTDFMPFAPVVRDVDFHKVFDFDYRDCEQIPRNFYFMTETINVRNFWKAKVPAVVHIDGTARPQVLTFKDNPLLYKAMTILAEEHELPLLINTSFNTHEEPIVQSEADAITALIKGRVDLLVSNNQLLEPKLSD